MLPDYYVVMKLGCVRIWLASFRNQELEEAKKFCRRFFCSKKIELWWGDIHTVEFK